MSGLFEPLAVALEGGVAAEKFPGEPGGIERTQVLIGCRRTPLGTRHELSLLHSTRSSASDGRFGCEGRNRYHAQPATRVAGSARNPNSVGGAAAQEVAVAVLRHPAGARQVGIPRAPRADRFACGVDVQDQLRDFLPVGAVLLRRPAGADRSRGAARHSRSGCHPSAPRRRRVDLAVESASSANPSRSFGIHVPQA